MRSGAQICRTESLSVCAQSYDKRPSRDSIGTSLAVRGAWIMLLYRNFRPTEIDLRSVQQGT